MKDGAMNDNNPIAVGDVVQRRGQPFMRGVVWSVERGMIIVQWDDPDENCHIRNPPKLEKVTPRPAATSPARLRPAPARWKSPEKPWRAVMPIRPRYRVEDTNPGD